MSGVYPYDTLEQRMFRSPETVTPADSLKTALVLAALLVVFVPVVALTTGIPLLVLVFFAGLLFLIHLLVTDRLLVGVGSAFFVLLTFYTDVPVVDVPGTERATVYLFDPLLLLVGVLGVYWHHQSSKRIPASGRLAVVLLSLFAGWSAISALVGNGPSQAAALVFTVDQVRFTLVLLFTALYVLHTHPRCVVYPLLVAISSHSAVALAQASNGTSFGLSYLGEGGIDPMGQVTIGPFIYQASQHTGGFTGNSRILVGLLLLLTPIFVVQLLDSRRKALLGFLGATLSGILVLIGNTDSGLAAFVLTMISLLGAFVVLYWRNPDVPRVRGSAVAISVVGGTIILRMWGRIARLAGGIIPRPGDGGSARNTDGSTAGSGDSAVNSGGPAVNETGSVVNDGGSTVLGGLINTDTLGIRLHQYAAALDIAGRYPLFGLGGSNFNLIAPMYGIPAEMAIHNIFLSYLAATGIPGLLLFLASLGATVLLTLRRVFTTSADRQLLLLGLLVGIISYLAFAFWTTMGEITVAMATFWSVCGIAIGASVTEE